MCPPATRRAASCSRRAARAIARCSMQSQLRMPRLPLWAAGFPERPAYTPPYVIAERACCRTGPPGERPDRPVSLDAPGGSARRVPGKGVLPRAGPTGHHALRRRPVAVLPVGGSMAQQYLIRRDSSAWVLQVWAAFAAAVALCVAGVWNAPGE